MTDIFNPTSVDTQFASQRTAIFDKKPQILVKVENADLKVKILPWTTIEDLKKNVVSQLNCPSISQKNVRLFHKTVELVENEKFVHDYNVVGNGAMVAKIRQDVGNGSKSFINPYKIFNKPEPKVMKLLETTMEALENGKNPELTTEGTSGVYQILSQKNIKISVFKPFDEEVNAPNNPRNRAAPLGSEGICKGILSGECATREVAAYVLDSIGEGFHGVPTTTYIQFYHPNFNYEKIIEHDPIPSLKEHKFKENKITKHGSLQEFINSEGIIGDYGVKKFSQEEIQKIAILDLRILNCDRNDGNVLVKQENGLTLIPIDHGLSFPDNFSIYEDSIFWMSSPQCKKPISPQHLEFIEKINPSEDYKLLEEKLGFRKICLRNFRIAQTFLKKAAKAGFTLYQIGKMVYRNDDDEPQRSELEKVVFQTEELYLNMKKKHQLQILEEEEDEFDDTAESLPPLSLLSLKKKVSLPPQLLKRTTSFRERQNEKRKQRQGPHGVAKSIWNKYEKETWSQGFYHSFENFLETYLTQKKGKK